ncbi:hypothetical protein CYMTET_52511 [Cymbomonas tetramitiformis]|uniref:Uncharacterized protein n=1 Tax=Cymbomonas tetramitiformis TaxID=36881 RepID=A0AAE0ER07_9CHLO|nr:hypothetical protein CYMTET_52511 [Cymbomonas tetramitiformis]
MRKPQEQTSACVESKSVYLVFPAWLCGLTLSGRYLEWVEVRQPYQDDPETVAAKRAERARKKAEKAAAAKAGAPGGGQQAVPPQQDPAAAAAKEEERKRQEVAALDALQHFGVRVGTTTCGLLPCSSPFPRQQADPLLVPSVTPAMLFTGADPGGHEDSRQSPWVQGSTWLDVIQGDEAAKPVDLVDIGANLTKFKPAQVSAQLHRAAVTGCCISALGGGSFSLSGEQTRGAEAVGE